MIIQKFIYQWSINILKCIPLLSYTIPLSGGSMKKLIINGLLIVLVVTLIFAFTIGFGNDVDESPQKVTNNRLTLEDQTEEKNPNYSLTVTVDDTEKEASEKSEYDLGLDELDDLDKLS